ncbi:transaldolase [Hyalangium versicolor]|uniref:transaldolase n=1 Tax=Hyalangium versicolor TaxID=2861190 RepID=UPI001CCDB495|nr:transaldolase [Hyalangium versicolor]
MIATQALHEAGQSLWLDHLTRELLNQGTLRHYINDLAVTGLTSNPTIFDQAIRRGEGYDESIRAGLERGLRGEALFFQLALEDLTRAAALFQGLHHQTQGEDGWVSLEVSPLLAWQPVPTLEQVLMLHARASLPNLFIKIPGTHPGLRAIEEAIYAGVPVNVTLLFSVEQYLAAANAYMRGIERRLEDGRSPDVPSVASLFVSRWDKAVQGKVPESLRNRLGIAVAQRTYRAHCALHESRRARHLESEGAALQKLLWASTGTKDPSAPDTLYVESLVAPDTINTMPESTLLAFADHGRVGSPLRRDGGDCEKVIEEFVSAGVDVESLAEQLQREGSDSFTKSWNDLMACLVEKSEALGVSQGAVR